jgi:hypothetical protein
LKGTEMWTINSPFTGDTKVKTEHKFTWSCLMACKYNIITFYWILSQNTKC